MKRFLLFNLLALTLIFLHINVHAQTLAFPEAEGFGRFSKGARGVANRQVYIVTNLNDAGSGSFRDAVSVSGRVVVFSVGGIINLASEVNVAANVTIAGQTAPGEGIVLFGKRVTFTGSNNSICRYLRIRLGATGNSGKDVSGLANGANMIFDHMSFSWGMDEVFSINWDNKSKAPDSVTVQNSIIAQGLHRENHSAGGLIQTPDGGKVSLIKNLYISNKTRNPKVKGINEFVNNVVYDYGNGNRLGDNMNYGWSGEGYIMGGSAGVSQVNIINNYFVGGPLTPPGDVTPFSRGTGTFNLFGSGNYFDNNKNGILDGTLVPYDTLGYPGIAPTGFRTEAFPYPAATPSFAAEQAYQYIIDNAGVSYPRRDQVDSLLIDEVNSRGLKGYYVYRETDLPFSNGGVGHVYGAPAFLDSDVDGMPDVWEDANGLNKNYGQDATAFNTLYPQYMNIEVYVNSLINTPPPSFVKAPAILSLSATSFATPVPNSKVVIKWSDKSDNEDNFVLERSSNGSTYTVVATLAANTTSYINEELVPNQTYFYRLKATNSNQSSVYSLPGSVKTPALPSPPDVPSNPGPANLAQVTDFATLPLTWVGSSNTTTYKVFVGTDQNNLEFKAEVTTPLYVLSALAANMTFYWRVDAVNSLGTTIGPVWSFKTMHPPGLVGHWKLDETLGTIASDHSNYHHDGSLANFTEYQWSTDAKFGGSLLYKTPTSLAAVTIPNADHLFFDANSFTISMWVKIKANTYTSSTGGDTYLIHKGTFEATTGKWYGLQLKDGKLTFAIDDGITKTNIDIAVTTGTNNVFNNQWRSIVAIRDVSNKQLRVYLDGMLIGSKAYTTLTIGRLTPITLGNSGENKPYRDLMDDVRLYNYALSVPEIQLLLNGIPLVSKATNPTPDNNSVVDDPRRVDLGWSGQAQSYNVFVGKSEASVQLASGLITAKFTLTALDDRSSYFWRVDAVRDGEVALGDVWSFATFDRVAPLALAKNITVQLDSTGQVLVDSTLVDNGSYDAYGIASMKLSKTTFDCTNVGFNIITFTVTDRNDNSSSTQDTITVTDVTAPNVGVKNITIQLDANGIALITPEQINDGSFDACGIASLSLDKTTFDCSSIGANVVKLTAVDRNGNSRFVEATVTVEDRSAPIVIIRNISVQLSESGEVAFTPAQIDNGSSDACGINTMSLDKTKFTCSDVGSNTIKLTVLDKNGNSSTTTALVLVEDKIVPIAIAKSISITLTNGVASLTANMINNGSYDACGIKSISVSKQSFDCSNIGSNNVVLSITDSHGNVSAATATVNVIGAVPTPVIFVMREDHIPTGADPSTIFLGYGAQRLQLRASASGATAFAWSPSNGLSSAIISNPVFTATQEGTFNYTVTIANAFGCTATANITIHVVDARCGNRLKKTIMCRHNKEICVSANHVREYLERGYAIGSCKNECDTPNDDRDHNVDLTVYPNPVTDNSKISFVVRGGGKYTLAIADLLGRFERVLDAGYAEGNESLSYYLDADQYRGNVYIIKLITQNGVKTQRIVIY